MKEIIDFFVGNPWFTLFGAVTLIQIAPIKINPWSWIFQAIKKALVGDLMKDIKDLKKDVLDERISNQRWRILDFANSCRQGRKHTKEEWDHCIDELVKYETRCKEDGIVNGVFVQAALYLRNTYQTLLSNNDFMV